jgi:hypothetical protein
MPFNFEISPAKNGDWSINNGGFHPAIHSTGPFSRSLGAAMPCDAESRSGGGADGIGAGDFIECPGQELKTLWMGQRNPINHQPDG